MKNTKHNLQLPSLKVLMQGHTEKEIKQAEENLLAYADLIAQIVDDNDSSSVSDRLLTDDE